MTRKGELGGKVNVRQVLRGSWEGRQLAAGVASASTGQRLCCQRCEETMEEVEEEIDGDDS